MRNRKLKYFAAGAVGVAIGSIGYKFYLDVQVKRNAPNTQNQVNRILENQIEDLYPKHEATRYGYPSLMDIRVRKGYVLGYDRRTRNPAWVAEHLTNDKLSKTNYNNLNKKDNVDRNKSTFVVDLSIPEAFRVHPNDFHSTGYDRGHLAPARNMIESQQSMDESFLMSNISPQVGQGFNRGYWSRLEGFIRHLTRLYSDVYIVTGPLYLPKKNKKTNKMFVKYEVIGHSKCAVPTHFFKVILVPSEHGDFICGGFILPNEKISENKDLINFQAPIEIIESFSGLEFFPKIRRNKNKNNIMDLCKETSCTIVKSHFLKKKSLNVHS